MSIRDRISSAIKAYKLGSPQQGIGVRFFEMQTPPGWGYQTYLKAYGEIGVLFAVVNVIAQAVSKVKWHLYEIDQGDRVEIFEHELIDFFNEVNPFQTRYQFMYLGTMYKLLVGEQFWQLNFDGGRKPVEMWLVPPAFMSVIPSPTKYIDHYEFKRNSYEVSFTVDEIIHIKTPNPFNEYRGLSPAQALTVDLDSERYAARYEQKFFFNDASPGLILEYPPDQMPPAETRKELAQEWDERFKGFRNRGKTAFLWGGKANTITMSNKDMDFANLRIFNRNAILAAYHVPPAILGVTESVNRSNAEASLYDFAMYCVEPELSEVREAMNKELVPFFGDNLYLDYDNPVPEDTAAGVNNAVNLFKAGIITRNDALALVDMEQLETPEGDEYFTPQPGPFVGGQPLEQRDFSNSNREIPKIGMMIPKEGIKKAILATEESRESFWKDYASHAESYEAKTIYELQLMYRDQKIEAIDKLQNATKDTELIDLKAAKASYVEKITPILVQVMSGAINNGRELLEPPSPHKQEIPHVLSQAALKWLKTRIGWAANQISEETASRLSQILADGYEQGLSIPQITKLIEDEFDFFSDVRAMRIARTEIMQASAQGTLEGYRDSEVVEKVEFYAALDERTCEDCMALHKEIFDLADSEGIITVHPNCRCTWLPVVE